VWRFLLGLACLRLSGLFETDVRLKAARLSPMASNARKPKDYGALPLSPNRTFLFSPRSGGPPESRAAASFNATVIELPRVSQYSALSE
jgi:hypothetical protein